MGGLELVQHVPTNMRQKERLWVSKPIYGKRSVFVYYAGYPVGGIGHLIRKERQRHDCAVVDEEPWWCGVVAIVEKRSVVCNGACCCCLQDETVVTVVRGRCQEAGELGILVESCSSSARVWRCRGRGCRMSMAKNRRIGHGRKRGFRLWQGDGPLSGDIRRRGNGVRD